MSEYSRPKIIPSIIEYLENHPDQKVYKPKMAAELGFTQKQINAGINNLRNGYPEYSHRIHSVVRGNVWIYSGDAAEYTNVAQKSTDDQLIFDHVRTLKNGDQVLADEEGNLYRLTKVL